MRKDKAEEQNGAVWVKRMGVGFAVGSILFFGLTAVFAVVGLKTDISEAKYRYFAWGAVVASAMLGGFLAVRPLRKNGLLMGGAVGAALAVPALIAVGVAADKTALSSMVTAAAVFLGCGALGGVTAANRKVRRKY